MPYQTQLNLLAEKDHKAELGGGEERIAKQHASGKLTARERIDLLFDKEYLFYLPKSYN